MLTFSKKNWGQVILVPNHVSALAAVSAYVFISQTGQLVSP